MSDIDRMRERWAGATVLSIAKADIDILLAAVDERDTRIQAVRALADD